MTQEKHFMLKGWIPPKVHRGIALMLEAEEVLPPEAARQWQRVPEIANAFFKLFKVGSFNNSQISR